MAAETLEIRIDGTTHTCRGDAMATIGSAADATVRIEHPGISRVHARVGRRNGAWVLEDVASTNGTFHNGVRVEQVRIEDGVTVLLGHPEEGVVMDLEPQPATPAAPTVVSASAPASASAPPPAPGPAPPPAGAWQRHLVWAIWALAAAILVLAVVVAVVGLS